MAPLQSLPARGRNHAAELASALPNDRIGKAVVSQFVARAAGAPSSTLQGLWAQFSTLAGTLQDVGGSLDAKLFDVLYARLEASGMAPLSKATLYSGAMGIVNRLMDDGVIPTFKVPRRYAYGAVLAATSAPRRMSDGAGPALKLSDEQLLEAVVEFAYAELEAWQSRRELASEIGEAARTAYYGILARVDESLGSRMDLAWAAAFIRDEQARLRQHGFPVDPADLASFAYCHLFAKEVLDGVPVTTTSMRRDSNMSPAERRYARKMKSVSAAYPSLFPSVLCPGQDQAAALAVLLAAAHVNANSIPELKSGCLRPTENPKVFVLAWHKRRAGGAMNGLPFLDDTVEGDDLADPSVSHDPATEEASRFVPDRGRAVGGRSIPAAVRAYREAASALRHAMGYRENDASAPLILTRPDKMYPSEKTANPFQPSASTIWRAVEEFRLRFVAAHADHIPGVADAKFTLKSVRVSAIHQHLRATRDPVATQAVAQHKGPRTTAYYLRHRESMQIHSEETRKIVDAMEAAVRTGTLVVVNPQEAPKGSEEIGHGASCRDRCSGHMPGQREGRPCDFFVGCFTCREAVVVATPLNYARITRWRDHLLSTRSRRDEAPDRWDRWILPQLRVIEDAMADFPADVAIQGKAIAPRLKLEFGAIW